MNLHLVAWLLGGLSFGISAFLLLPALLALGLGEPALPFFAAGGLSAAAALLLRWWGGLPRVHLSIREGIAVTGLGWILAAFLGLLPYVFGGWLSALDALFESISGFTGTGASIIVSVESLPRSLLLWRSLTHWIGGFAIIVMFTALLPQLAHGSLFRHSAEGIGGLHGSRVLPRIRTMARMLLAVYALLTAAAGLVYLLCGMPPFAAASHALSTVSTGGFSIYDDSARYFDDPLIEGAMTFFMIAAGGNFWLYYLGWKKGLHLFTENTEFKAYLTLLLLAIVLIAANLVHDMGLGPADALRYASFQAASFASTTGFVSSDFDNWPSFSRFCLLLLMFIGGCAGSTAGGLRVSRMLLLQRMMFSILWQKLHPQGVRQERLNGIALSEDALFNAGRFFFMYIMLNAFWVFLLTADTVPALDAIAVSISAMAGVGPVLELSGSAYTYATLPEASKFVVCLAMLFGRLEIFTLLVMLSPEFWHEKTGW